MVVHRSPDEPFPVLCPILLPENGLAGFNEKKYNT